jgi:alkylhydroperoxidase family enzyme
LLEIWSGGNICGAAQYHGYSLLPCKIQELQKFFTDDEIVELTLVVCMANFTNRFNDALKVEPDLG